jgi:Acetyl co-enzyme A carboxylase carboxyltransferase-like
LPVVCVIDTPGAELSARAEEDGLASEIAHCLADLITLAVPTVSLLLGQGAGGAALALLPADRVLAAQHAWLAPLAPEGVSAIVYRDTSYAPQLAARQRIGSADLAADGIVDQVIPETPADPDRFCRDLGYALHRALEDLANQDDDTRLAGRLHRYRRLGTSPHRRPLPVAQPGSRPCHRSPYGWASRSPSDQRKPGAGSPRTHTGHTRPAAREHVQSRWRLDARPCACAATSQRAGSLVHPALFAAHLACWRASGAADADPYSVHPRDPWPTASMFWPRCARRRARDDARRHDAIVIEDDYDSEFRYDREPIGTLRGLAPGPPGRHPLS